MDTFYRAVDSATPDLLQVPQHFVERIPSFRSIRTADNPVHAALFHARSEARPPGAPCWPYKAMIEWAFEVTRLSISPWLPSRLRSLFAFVSADDAIAFASESGKSAVFSGRLETTGARVSVHDFGRYYVRTDEIAITDEGFGCAWSEAGDAARSYWAPDAQMQRSEALIAGSLVLESTPLWVAPAADGTTAGAG